MQLHNTFEHATVVICCHQCRDNIPKCNYSIKLRAGVRLNSRNFRPIQFHVVYFSTKNQRFRKNHVRIHAVSSGNGAPIVFTSVKISLWKSLRNQTQPFTRTLHMSYKCYLNSDVVANLELTETSCTEGCCLVKKIFSNRSAVSDLIYI